MTYPRPFDLLMAGTIGLVLGIAMLIVVGTAANATTLPKKITIAGVAGSSDAWTGDVILREAYSKLGIKLEIRKLPGARALKFSSSGQLDGEVLRIDALKNAFPMLQQVNPPITFIEAAVFSSGPKFTVDGWKSLSPYSIGVIRGIKFATDNTSGMTRYIAPNYQTLFKMLSAGRLQVGVVPRINGLWHQTLLGDAKINELRPALQRFDLFHYLHRKHSSWAPRLEVTLTEMKASGRFTEIKSHVERVLLNIAAGKRSVCADYVCFESGLRPK